MKRLKSLIGIGVIVAAILFLTKGSFVEKKVNKVKENEKVKKAVEEFEEDYEEVSKDKDWNLLREIMNQ